MSIGDTQWSILLYGKLCPLSVPESQSPTHVPVSQNIFFRLVDRTVMQPALKIARFCDFSPEIMSTWFRRIIAEARNENPVDKPLMTKVSKKSTQTGSDSSNSMPDLRNRSCL